VKRLLLSFLQATLPVLQEYVPQVKPLTVWCCCAVSWLDGGGFQPCCGGSRVYEDLGGDWRRRPPPEAARATSKQWRHRRFPTRGGTGDFQPGAARSSFGKGRRGRVPARGGHERCCSRLVNAGWRKRIQEVIEKTYRDSLAFYKKAQNI
jgi:hypothetical protein